MDQRTQRELEELKHLRKHLQLQQDLPKKIKSDKSAWDKSVDQWENNMKQQAWKQAQAEMTFKMPGRKPTDHAERVSAEIRQKIDDEWARKEKVHKGVKSVLRVISVIVAILVVLGIHWYIGTQVFDPDFNSDYASLMKMIPGIESDDAFDQETFTMLAIGQFFVIAAINGFLCFALCAFGGDD